MTTDRATVSATTLDYPRIGPNRELKRVIEGFWAGRVSATDLDETTTRLRLDTLTELHQAGLDEVPTGTQSRYDHVLDTAVLLGAVPPRHVRAGEDPLDTYFAMARGRPEAPALEMTKWFGTNYHYLVPEIGPDTPIALRGDQPVRQYREAVELGIPGRPVLLGPVTFLLLSAAAADAPAGFDPLDRLDDVLAAYRELLGQLKAAGAGTVQLDEPSLVTDLSQAQLDAFTRAYAYLAESPARPELWVQTYYGFPAPAALGTLAGLPVHTVGLDFSGAAGEDLPAAVGEVGLRGKRLAAGLVDGRNVWRTDLRRALATATVLAGMAAEVVVTAGSPLLHVPVDLAVEDELPAELVRRLAFAKQKVAEVVAIARGLREGTPAIAEQLAASDLVHRTPVRQDTVLRARIAGLSEQDELRPAPAEERFVLQQKELGLPRLPTTTIGSFPQTGELRRARAGHRTGELSAADYHAVLRAEVDKVVALQEELDLDVLVHGEPERTDMVEYFAEKLAGFAVTKLGWVQSYGTRCARPPIVHGDVTRPEPMTVEYSAYAQSRTTRPVKGMLTGPVTLLQWAFVRIDQPRADTANQVALALRDEVADLEAAGLRVIQVDEPGLLEGVPLRAEHRADYLKWSVRSFRLATAGAKAATQVHTHVCYAELATVVEAVRELDVDVISIESARSGGAAEAVGALTSGVGPGVFDVHSPVVPEVAEQAAQLRRALRWLPAERVWVNPDCGLKTRGYAEVEPALRVMVEAARTVRAEIDNG
ncbi:5-methyltetrahydropteroyltriglutamate--homocysteine S-methyltransferase [Crossiella cryophila]|uniref:5-methyltetrahydropteroyltriglutamate--homocysteine S-methyltransferase n=1 Tax=Crossiella cryophila TaxID=43355 RepID=A0A7W7CGR8_9PSEU|nr:5-methyltetrahydropteroyltriglutamate--homocysteine S-methyltransferase [Crossiella cryophila]MBB4680805.1 5-methyltetrahydropteroyltriglutamate--homocysteine methyltransferase [Crossiella cryophila]